jgi:hypothetical protein
VAGPIISDTAGTTSQTVLASGEGAALAGDLSFTVQATTTNLGTNTWQVTVRVSWPPLNATGIAETIVVTRQQSFQFPAVCS